MCHWCERHTTLKMMSKKNDDPRHVIAQYTHTLHSNVRQNNFINTASSGSAAWQSISQPAKAWKSAATNLVCGYSLSVRWEKQDWF